ncbi:retrovirus-related Pol polyprotein from transposon 17.6 [Trichonephila clavipes]|nr:retrovirus-related Pol polyprotein from transposon 17.6 [Trichonephila clavipes]
MHKKDLPAKIARWALMLEEFDYEVCHRSGRQMKHDDALSPYPIMIISSHGITQKIKEAQNKDEFISQLKSAIKITPSDEYYLKNEILYKLQRIMNSTTTRSTKFTPFEVLIGVKMKQKEDFQIKHLLKDELSEKFINKRETLRNEAKENILRLQDENKKQYNKHRKPAYNYKPGDTVAIQRTQFGTGLKLRPKYFGPYEVTKVHKHDRYEVQEIGQHEGPNVTSTSADKMKKCVHFEKLPSPKLFVHFVFSFFCCFFIIISVHLFPQRRGRRGHQDARVDVSYSQTTSEAMHELK